MTWFNNEKVERLEQFRHKASERIRELASVRDKLEADLEGLEKQLSNLTAAGERLAKISGVEEQVVLGQLAMVQESTQWWRSLLTLIKSQSEMESSMAIGPNLSNETRAYNAGRAAGLADFHQALIQLWMRAQKPQ